MKPERRVFRNIRIAVLLAVLAAVALSTLATRRRLHAWTGTLTVNVVPIAAEDDPRVQAYVASLPPDAFEGVGRFLEIQASRHGRKLEGQIRVVTSPPIPETPPDTPDANTSRLAVALWSLQLRFFDWEAQHTHHLPDADVRLFVLFHLVHPGESLDASVGLEQGHVGIVQAPAGDRDRGWTELAITHELLHTLGATDKYDETGAPRMPEGLGEPDLSPTLPQRRCEVMAGTIAVDAGKNVLARSLLPCVVNAYTATEIGWLPERSGAR